MEYQTVVVAYWWTVWGKEKGKKDSGFENCYVTDKEYTMEQILFLYNAQCDKRYEATSAELMKVIYITIDLLRGEIVKKEEEDF